MDKKEEKEIKKLLIEIMEMQDAKTESQVPQPDLFRKFLKHISTQPPKFSNGASTTATNNPNVEKKESGTTDYKALDPALAKQIDAYFNKGDELYNAGKLYESVQQYNEAWKLLPEPKEDWEIATSLLTSIGDAGYYMGKLELALKAYGEAIRCPDGADDPYLHLRLGQLFFEKGQLDNAADQLARAYIGGGVEMFEDEHPKYLDFLKTRADLSES